MEFVEVLKPAIGDLVYNNQGEMIGHIAEITKNMKEETQYIIIGFNNFSGIERRYFAIPATIAYVEIEESGKTILDVEKEDLRVAQKIRLDQCPTIEENNFLQSIFEVSDYSSPSIANHKKHVLNI